MDAAALMLALSRLEDSFVRSSQNISDVQPSLTAATLNIHIFPQSDLRLDRSVVPTILGAERFRFLWSLSPQSILNIR
jgi:hypothetical protein